MPISNTTFVVAVLWCLAASASASEVSISSQNGIDAVGLRGPNGELLDGTGVKIGQVERQRPADPDEDDVLTNTTLNPAQVWVQQQNPFEDAGVGNHATQVASVMISFHQTATGVAKGASLYSDAYVEEGTSEVEPLNAIQHVLIASGGGVRAVNNSWLKPGPTQTATRR